MPSSFLILWDVAFGFLVGGVICLVNSDNGRDSNMLTSIACYLLGQVGTS